MFRSARTIFWAQLPPPSVGGLRRRDPVTCGFAGSRPAPSRRPRAVSSGLWGSATPGPSAGVQDRQVDGSSVPARAHLPSPRPHASFSAGRARLQHPTRAFTRGRPRHSPGAPVPIARRPSARPASRLLRALLAMRCPGSGPSVRPSGSRLGRSRRCCRGSPLVSPSRLPVARLPSPSEPARGEPVDRRDVCCCRADPEASESPFTPHRVPSRA
jgi:hypothetical protein